uniref:Uncharacterized protein n=1 Tax=Anguilla anguilla TaxID=7936 RepID=A0A0E9RDR2_ANGAN
MAIKSNLLFGIHEAAGIKTF